MDGKTKAFLEGQLIPSYAILLLELYGIVHIEDLKQIGEDEIKSIEESVRDGSFGALVDMESKSVRVKYLGIDLQNLQRFSFRMLDLKKLKAIGVSAAAQTAANATKTSVSS